MSETDLDLVHRAVEAWNSNDWETIREVNHPHAEIIPPPGWPEGGSLRGWEAIRDQFKRLKDAWSDEQVQDLGAEQLRDGVVLSHVRWIGHGQASGLELDQEMWNLYVLEREKIVRTVFGFEREAALRAAEESR